MPELGTSGSDGPGRETTQVYPTKGLIPARDLSEIPLEIIQDYSS